MSWFSPCILSMLLIIVYSHIFVSGEICEDRFPQCKDHLDDCLNVPGWMTINCPQSCHYCHLRDPKIRCDPTFLNISTIPVISVGYYNKQFILLESDHNFKPLSREPWLLEKENFLTDTEVDQLLALASHWENSTESGTIDAIGEGTQLVVPSRTSSSFWCIHDCKQQIIVKKIYSRVEALLNISQNSFEPLQLLRYHKDQRYVEHHDYSFQELSLACGPRIMTFFVYLSDVENGGETSFPQLSITVKPKKGKAIVWANTLDVDPSIKDIRMTHEALPVVEGIKYGANLWIHLNEWLRPSLWGCTGA